ncbi:MAG: carbamoyl phosphate synthase small subunit [Verrucomicrobia bacterium]|nr:MAG: carbamoyl phosphate synthase small subunit [Verrucomicrobiota bacterium]
MQKAILALEDGRIFRGEAFGHTSTSTGEICFNTSMTGYQEILTDPSYCGQIVTMTYPEIGNYGVNSLDIESDRPYVHGFVIEELSPIVSNWRAEATLHDYLTRYHIPGISGIDTRALTRHLRIYGAMKACLTTEIEDEDQVIALAQNCEGVEGVDLVCKVTSSASYDWDPDDIESRTWVPINPALKTELNAQGDAFFPLPEAKYPIVAYDLGMKRNILRSLRRSGFKVRVVPAETSAKEILDTKPKGVFLSNGPGDPATLNYVMENVRALAPQIPIFGICLGHQILGRAFGGNTFKLKFGHHGANQPVKDLRTGKISITSQNHGFAVAPDSLPSNIEITHINLNDGTVAGLRHREYPTFSVQYHPEASPGPHDGNYLFRQFFDMVEKASPANG